MRRREFIRQAGAIIAALRAPIVFASQAPDLSQRIARVIGEYDRQGIHRTGSDVDTKSARWLAGAVRRCGLNPTLEPFIINRVDPKSCYSSGHELGHIGLEAFMGRRHDLVKTARAWIHFGANIGAAQEPSHRLQASSDEFEQIAMTAGSAAHH